ncbi:MAG: hypothetical protein ACOCSE_05845 [Chitinivibrionales bacterium]
MDWMIIKDRLMPVLFLIWLSLYAQAGAGTHDPVTDADYKYSVSAGAGVRVPYNYYKDKWERHTVGGVRLNMPALKGKLDLGVWLLGGKMSPLEPDLPALYTVIGVLSLSYRIQHAIPFMDLKPFLGVSNALISKVEGRLTSLDAPFKHSESEFGVVAGFDTGLRIRRFIVSLPMSVNVVLSSPNKFCTFNATLVAGVRF